MWSAEKGLAPRLLHDGTSGPRYGALRLIVTDFVEGKTLHDVYGKNPIPDNVREAIRKALDEFAKEGFIFDDLRTPNIMLAQDAGEPIEKRLRFIEFDRACCEGDGVKYPFHICRDIQESAGG
ncbi:hypothetical protein MPER_05495 [Moniliophthora perniciosa FA553]|nr:hypothetical protein MPER_05495 [Moniliophthora perniciosa FA553]